jgi:glutamate 5-kinase
MQRYEESFGRRGMPVAQVLLTHADLADRVRTNNARDALAALLDAGAVPVINENDAVRVEEIKFGDNDQLAADGDPARRRRAAGAALRRGGAARSRGRACAAGARRRGRGATARGQAATSGVGTGGMLSKVGAAERATLAGAFVVIASAREPSIVRRVLSGDDVGTLFVPSRPRLPARKHWIAYALRPKGALVLDPGAAAAVRSGKRSVLAVGLAGVRGRFEPGDPVSLVSSEGVELARGLARRGTLEVAELAGVRPKRGDESPVIVHHDDLVVLG